MPPPPPPTRLDALNALPLPAFRAEYLPHLPSLPRFNLDSLNPNPTLTPDSNPDSNTNTNPTHEPSATNEPSTLHLRTSKDLTPAEFTACFHLVRDTSAQDYRASVQGWHPASKRREMRLRDLRYLLVLGRDGRVEGFLSFMLTVEDGGEVVYVYEVHLEEGVRGKGVGRWLVGCAEEVGRRVGVGKVMLTVFRGNAGARGFYAGLGFGVDGGSPRGRVLRGGGVREVDYLILSKGLGGGGGDGGEGEGGGERRDG